MDMLIFRDGDGYSVEYLGAIGRQMRALFGSTIIPTAYTNGTRAVAVQEALSRLNPSLTVCLHPDLLEEEVAACSIGIPRN
jgi:hypothetical protein